MKPILKIENRMHVFRAERRLTQEELANAIGVTRMTVNSIEQGNYNPSLELAFRIARYFDTTVEDVFFIHGGSSDKKKTFPKRA